MESPKPLPVGEVLKSVGYGTGLQNQPKRVLESEGFQEILSKYLPEDLIAERHTELLNAVNLEKLSFSEKDTDEEITEVVSKMEGYKLLYIKNATNSEGRVIDKYAYVKAPDNMARDKALDKAYKLRGRYKTDDEGEKPKDIKPNIYNFFYEPVFQQNIKNYDENFKNQILKAQNVEETGTN